MLSLPVEAGEITHISEILRMGRPERKYILE
jgi:hypothetical protein